MILPISRVCCCSGVIFHGSFLAYDYWCIVETFILMVIKDVDEQVLYVKMEIRCMFLPTMLTDECTAPCCFTVLIKVRQLSVFPPPTCVPTCGIFEAAASSVLMPLVSIVAFSITVIIQSGHTWLLVCFRVPRLGEVWAWGPGYMAASGPSMFF